jgi:hypothetical protein
MAGVKNSFRGPCSNKSMITRLLLVPLLALAVPAAAQTIYKYERPDGTFLYSDKPVKGAKLVERFTVAQAPRQQTPPAQPQAGQPPRPSAPPARGEPRSEVPSENPPNMPQNPAPPPAQSQTSALDAANAEVIAAQKALDDAKARLAQGGEPQPGERSGNAGGKSSRLNDDYFARQQQLEAEVKEANQRLELAYQRRSQAK